MKEQAFQKVTEYIDAMAVKLGVAAEHVYEILVRQQYVEGITVLIGCLLFVVVSLFIARKTTELTSVKREERKGKYVSEISEDLALVAYVLSWTVFFIALLVSVFAVPDCIAQFINPEYYAIKEILDTIGGK